MSEKDFLNTLNHYDRDRVRDIIDSRNGAYMLSALLAFVLFMTWLGPI